MKHRTSILSADKPSRPGVFPDIVDLMAAKMSSSVGGFAMSSCVGCFSIVASVISVAAVGRFSSWLNYSLHVDTISVFVKTCEPSAPLTGAIAVFCGPLICLIAAKKSL